MTSCVSETPAAAQSPLAVDVAFFEDLVKAPLEQYRHNQQEYACTGEQIIAAYKPEPQ